jgi:CRP-like cAMP-binding protein
MTGLSRRSRMEALIQGAWSRHIARLSCLSRRRGADAPLGGDGWRGRPVRSWSACRVRPRRRPRETLSDDGGLPPAPQGQRGAYVPPCRTVKPNAARLFSPGYRVATDAPSAAQGRRERLRDNVVITLAAASLAKLSSFLRRKTALPDLLGRRWSDGCDDVVGGVTASFLAASAAASWLVPALMFLLVIVVSLAGLRWIRSEHLEALRSVPLFSSLSKHQLMRILRAARAIEFQPSVEIIREGEAGKGLYTVTDGSAKVLVDGNQLATLGPGSYFGEIAVIDGGPRTATIVAATRVSTLELTPSAFLRILDSEPQLARALSAELCGRLRDTGGDSGDCGDDAPVDRARLVELCQRLRRTEHPDWTPGTPSRRRWLGLSSLFARGS